MYDYAILLTLVIYFGVIYSYASINDNLNTYLKINIFPMILFSILLYIILLIYICGTFITRTTQYKNYLKKCKKQKNKFCHIKKLDLSIPSDLVGPLLKIARENGKRIEIPRKRQKAISLKHLNVMIPEIVEWYQTLPDIISKVIGEKVQITPLSQPNSLCLVVYEKMGDYIDWHFDTNHYNGRYFTLLLPVTFEQTCGNYQYKNADNITEDLQFNNGEALLFEGDKVYHRGNELCDNQFRVVLSCTFTTSQEIPIEEYIFQNVKNIGIFGEL
jgi:hypothetical protein